MSDGKFSLGDIAAAAQPTRYQLLAFGAGSWFRSTAAAEELNVQPATIREAAAILVEAHLLEARPVAVGRREGSEWRVTPRGATLRNKIAALLEAAPAAYLDSAVPAAVVAIAASVAPEDIDLVRVLERALTARASAVKGVWLDRPDAGAA
jgi:hypothetical protein